ncbi:Hypothetical predicted protein [Pelobates cultripes]|uniref:Uncharacterized protein n=1 Tax=Pelobates cultripes TaxID=61616 RepID=A0AAD1WBA3_PELCU|nr:Hypothetical predicted protein [Pelobates cultripes]
MAPPWQSELPLATKADLLGMVTLKAFFTAELTVLKNLEVTADRLPQFFKKLFSAILPPKQTKGLTTDGLFRIPEGLHNKTDTARDIIMRFKSQLDKEGFLSATRGQTPLTFEDHSLNFYQDLNHQTLQWRASLKEVTMQLKAADITYKWGYLRALIAERDGHRHRLTSTAEVAQFLHFLSIHPAPSPMSNPAHRWDVAKITPFTPARPTAPE